MPNPTLAALADDLAAGRTSARKLVEECIARIADPAGEGQRAFIHVDKDAALQAADAMDRLRQAHAAPSRFAGIPVSIKDLFDIRGQVTRAGSRALEDSAPAEQDAAAVARLRGAGFVVIGRTNMTEFAFSGLGLNPNYGTPLNPWDRATGRIPGGSSSGAAVSVTDGMAYGALGTDTGGSCRIPAAMCGIVGFKPTASRVPLAGTFPLSPALDSVGPLAHSVDCCATLDTVLSGQGFEPIPDLAAADLNLGVLTNYVTDGLEKTVADNFERALRALTKAGVKLTDMKLPELAELPDINRKGGISAAESYAVHRPRIAKEAARYDPRVLIRIMRGQEQDAADYIDLLNIRADFIIRVARRIRKFDAVLMPTIPIVAPVLSDLTSDEAYVKANGLALRNPSIVNFIDGCAISLPCHEPGTAPTGLSLFGLANTDANLLSLARVVEPIVAIDA